jgi:hypothetical protein
MNFNPFLLTGQISICIILLLGSSCTSIPQITYADKWQHLESRRLVISAEKKRLCISLDKASDVPMSLNLEKSFIKHAKMGALNISVVPNNYANSQNDKWQTFWVYNKKEGVDRSFPEGNYSLRIILESKDKSLDYECEFILKDKYFSFIDMFFFDQKAH